MRYLALGDSISIDYWTGIEGGGAVNQFAAKIGARGADLQDLTADGRTAAGVVDDLERIRIRPEVITLTAGGNDFLLGRPTQQICENLSKIAERLAGYGCPVLLSTIYDPTDGDDRIGAQMGIDPAQRAEYERINDHLRALARERSFILSDLQKLFLGNGLASRHPWIHHGIEPNHMGATAIAGHWLGLYAAHRGYV